jgi:hypothetical protein
MNKLLLALLATAALAAGTGTAHAQSTTGSGNIDAEILTPLTINESTRMNFGRVVSSASGGTVTILAASDTANVTGGVVALGTNPSIARGVFAITGTGNQPYTVTLPASPVNVTSGASTMSVGTFTIQGGTSRTLSSGTDTLRLGATLTLGPNQAAGVYTGIYSVTVSY